MYTYNLCTHAHLKLCVYICLPCFFAPGAPSLAWPTQPSSPSKPSKNSPASKILRSASDSPENNGNKTIPFF